MEYSYEMNEKKTKHKQQTNSYLKPERIKVIIQKFESASLVVEQMICPQDAN